MLSPQAWQSPPHVPAPTACCAHWPSRCPVHSFFLDSYHALPLLLLSAPHLLSVSESGWTCQHPSQARLYLCLLPLLTGPGQVSQRPQCPGPLVPVHVPFLWLFLLFLQHTPPWGPPSSSALGSRGSLRHPVPGLAQEGPPGHPTFLIPSPSLAFILELVGHLLPSTLYYFPLVDFYFVLSALPSHQSM